MIETVISEVNLEKWCKILPECEIFMRNFFWTCQGFDYETNKKNYMYDLALYAKTEKWPPAQLLLAFYDIAVDVRETN